MDNITAIIPAYNPDKKFHTVIEGLVQAGFKHIIVINDGTDICSEKDYAYIMPRERSVDIDSEIDFKFAELLIKNNL